MADKMWDVFISHASEDKEDFVRPLAQALAHLGVKVWYDEFTLKVGDSLSRSIDNGLANSTYGTVVISSSFIQKQWPERELRGLVAREVEEEQKVILPIWFGVTKQEVLRFSPTLADTIAIRSEGMDAQEIALSLLKTIRPDIYKKHPRAELEKMLSGLTLSDPVLHLEPENGLFWSTQPNQTVGVFTFLLHNTGREDIDNITVTEDYFVALKGDRIVIKSPGGLPVENLMPPVLKSTQQAPVRVNFSGHTKIMNEVADNFKNGPSLRGVKVTIKFRRRADGKDFSMVRGYAAVGPNAEGIYTEGSEYDSKRLEFSLSLSEVTPHFNSSEHWTAVTKEIGQDKDGRQTVRHY